MIPMTNQHSANSEGISSTDSNTFVKNTYKHQTMKSLQAIEKADRLQSANMKITRIFEKNNIKMEKRQKIEQVNRLKSDKQEKDTVDMARTQI